MVTYPGATCSQYWASIMHCERTFFAGRNPSGSLAMGVLQVSRADCRVYARRSKYAHPPCRVSCQLDSKLNTGVITPLAWHTEGYARRISRSWARWTSRSTSSSRLI